MRSTKRDNAKRSGATRTANRARFIRARTVEAEISGAMGRAIVAEQSARQP
jgi:hypothetical protein